MCCPQAFIRSADVFQCDFWELPAVQQLARDAATAPLLKLLDVMLNGDLAGGLLVLWHAAQWFACLLLLVLGAASEVLRVTGCVSTEFGCQRSLKPCGVFPASCHCGSLSCVANALAAVPLLDQLAIHSRRKPTMQPHVHKLLRQLLAVMLNGALAGGLKQLFCSGWP
jgi:hypothetical protein